MGTIRKHLCTNIEGLLRNMKDQDMSGLFSDENGNEMDDLEIRKNLSEAQAKGHKLIGSDSCEGFDPFGGGCPGHDLNEETNQLIMYYIIKAPESKKHYVKRVENSTNETYRKLEKDGFDMKGQYGREDYAKHWVDWYNGDIEYEAHRKFLNLKS